MNNKIYYLILALLLLLLSSFLFNTISFDFKENSKPLNVIAGRNKAEVKELINYQRDLFIKVRNQETKKGYGTGVVKRSADSMFDKKMDIILNEMQKIALLKKYITNGYFGDETVTLGALSQIKPGKLDFDPKTYHYGGSYIYSVGAMIFLGMKLSFFDTYRKLSFYVDDPEAIGNLYLCARIPNVIGFLAIIILTYYISTMLFSPRTALFAAFFCALSPALIRYAVVAKPHIYATFWTMSAICLLLKYHIECSKQKYFIFSSMCFGMAVGANIVHAVAGIFIVCIIFDKINLRASLQKIFILSAIAFLVYAITNPYVISNINNFKGTLIEHGIHFERHKPRSLNSGLYVFISILKGLGIIIGISLITGILSVFKGSKNHANSLQRNLAIALIVTLFIVSFMNIPIRTVLFIFPVLAIFGGNTFSLLTRKAYNTRTFYSVVVTLFLCGALFPNAYTIWLGVKHIESIESGSIKYASFLHNDNIAENQSIGMFPYPQFAYMMPPLFQREVYAMSLINPQKIEDESSPRPDYIFITDTFKRFSELEYLLNEEYKKVFDVTLPKKPVWLEHFISTHQLFDTVDAVDIYKKRI